MRQDKDENQIYVNIEKIIDECLLDYKTEPVDLRNIGHADNEDWYLSVFRHHYARTVHDIVCQFGKQASSIKVLEIGAFLGLVSIALSRIGFDVTAVDIPEYIANRNLQRKFNKHGIHYVECNLRDYELPFDDEEFDVVIMCEVLEHLNFNPLPVIKEINRVLRPNGLMYLTLPNIASLGNRMKLLQGKSIHNPIKDFFLQLDPNENIIVGLHWREYTTEEIKEMLEQMDFEVVKQRYENAPAQTDSIVSIKRIVITVLRCILGVKPIRKVVSYCIKVVSYGIFDPDRDPSVKNTQVNFALKKNKCLRQFHYTNATSPIKPDGIELKDDL